MDTPALDRSADSRDEIAAFLAAYPQHVCETALALRRLVRDTVPGAREMLDVPAKIVGYGFGAGYADMICSIIPSQRGVKLGIAGGAELADPDGLLQGTGKRHRHMVVVPGAELRVHEITRLLEAAVAAWELRRKPGR